MTRIVTLILGLCLIGAPLGCAKKREPLSAQAQVVAGEYGVAFEAAKDELRRLGFSLDRIDARAGVITTQPKTSAGWATPWERVESTARQETDDLIHRQRRIVTVSFSPVSEGVQSSSEDLRRWTGPFRVDVRVAVERVYRFGMQLQPVSIRLSSVATDPDLRRRGAQPGLAVVSDNDEWLAGRIAGRIQRELGEPAPASEPAPG
jgi:hypothetical protein